MTSQFLLFRLIIVLPGTLLTTFETMGKLTPILLGLLVALCATAAVQAANSCANKYSATVQSLSKSLSANALSAMQTLGSCRRTRYRYFSQKVNYVTAKATCIADGGVLALPRNKHENELVRQTAIQGGQREHRGIYIGYNRLGTGSRNVWVDDNGFGIKYHPMLPHEPNNHGGDEQCGEMVVHTNGGWNDLPCNWEGGRQFVCQYD